MGKFRVRMGDHIDDQLGWLPRSRVLAYAAEAGVENADAMSDPVLRAEVRKTRIAERRWRAGSIVASPKPMASRWPEKYERVGDDLPESAGESTLKRNVEEIEDSYTEAGVQQAWEAEHGNDDLHRLDMSQLRELAYTEGIDLGGAADKAAVLATIRRTRKAVAEDR